MTLRILAIDTTSNLGSLALLEGEQILEEVLLRSDDGFGHILFAQVGALLERHAWKPGTVDCFAATAGPGSFTGVRVGLAAVKGLAEALGKPVVAVSNLQAMATFGTARLRAVVLDARRGEVYGAVYNNELDPVTPECVTTFARWLETLPEGDLELIAADIAPFQSALVGTRFENVRVKIASSVLAAAVAKIARQRLLAGQAADPADVDANYVRRSDAELFWKEG